MLSAEEEKLVFFFFFFFALLSVFLFSPLFFFFFFLCVMCSTEHLKPECDGSWSAGGGEELEGGGRKRAEC